MPVLRRRASRPAGATPPGTLGGGEDTRRRARHRDAFRLTFGPSSSAPERLLVLAASLFVDLVHFERKAG